MVQAFWYIIQRMDDDERFFYQNEYKQKLESETNATTPSPKGHDKTRFYNRG